ncbi:hypothetical protein [Massilia rubra]|uniref:hypothetical protein n=1 Tax=Massilia rubra TaxID=2607910 RepID=UPI00142051DB|nr:hypothetical protein [Massilia rubra]
MSDEQFDAFLRGEDDLSRRLQGLTQPASGPKLDAAILGYVKAGLEQEARAARPAAANDAVIEGAPPRLAPGLGRRWRIPAGIAAGVLAGVLGHQIYQGSGGGAGMEGGMAAAPTAEAPQVVANVTLDMERPAPPVAMDVPAPSAPAPARVAAAPAPAPAPVMKAAPPSPAPAPVQVAAAPPSQELQRVEITGSSIKRTVAESTLPVEALKQKDSKQSYQGYSSDNPVPEMQSPPVVASARAPEPVAAPAPAPAPVRVAAAPPAEPVADDARAAAAAPAARPARARVAGRESKTELELSKASPFDAHDKRALDWLAVIDAMLKAKLDKDALAEWTRFRAAYPDYPVPAATRDRIAAIKP